ncbi:protein phosphatase, partial [Streptomyces hygroscopicus]|uniref:SpoIIE family protein phosphatase n=1 Tax=Streptomyces hygroscopicus TaxID=1912 RepID=UPI00223EC2CF
PEHVPRPQATTTYTPGDTLILYTDGLIERRGEDIDTGLTRLTSTLATCTEFGAEHLADALLARLGLASGAGDDIAMVVVRLDRTTWPS